MRKTKKSILAFCVVLMIVLVFLIPYNAKMAEPDSRFGINAFVLNRYNWEEWEKPISVLKELNVNWTREEFIWRQIEPEKGKYDWTFYDRAFESLSRSNINILGIIDYSAPWATDDPNRPDADKYMPNMEDWRDYVSKVVDRYGYKVKYWQIWNEPNLPTFFKPQPDSAKYLELLKNASEVIRSQDSSAKVVLGGLSGVDVGYLEELKKLDAGRYFDILAVHPYRFDFKSPPESGGLMDDLKKAEKAAEDFNNKDIWLTEFGWPTDSTEGVSEDIQAKFLVRTYLMSFVFPNIKKLFWYDFRNDGYDKNYREDNFGLVRRDYTKKSSFLAYKNLIDILGYSNFEKMNSDGKDGFYDFSFRKNGSKIRVIWKINGSDSISIDDPNNQIRIFNTFGNEISFDNKNGEIKVVPVSDFPVFMVSGSTIVDRGITYGQVYDYDYVSQSPHLLIKNEEEREAWIKIKNTGTAIWKNNGANPVFLGTCRGQDRQSRFFTGGNWIGSNRAASLKEYIVRPGETGTFHFRFKANDSSDGKYREYFCPVVEGIIWMKDIGIYWDVNVNNFNIEGISFIHDFDYEYVEQNGGFDLSKGQKVSATIKLKNIGKKDWEKGKFNLGTSRSKDRSSLFSGNWTDVNRVSLEQDIVRPGGVGTFTFDFIAPNQSGVYKEYFRPVVDGLDWLKDIGIYWKIKVN